MAIHLRQLVLLSPGLSQDDMSLLDTAITTCCNENLELGCMLIEKAATEKAARDIDEAFEMAYQNRKDHRMTHVEPYFDAYVCGF
jgi:CCR4-NOT transcription complex subunit 1